MFRFGILTTKAKKAHEVYFFERLLGNKLGKR